MIQKRLDTRTTGITNAEFKQTKKHCIWEPLKTHFASWLPKNLPYGKVSTGTQSSEKKHIIQKRKYKSKPLNIL